LFQSLGSQNKSKENKPFNSIAQQLIALTSLSMLDILQAFNHLGNKFDDYDNGHLLQYLKSVTASMPS
jgi:hypothetical protein